MAAPRRRCNPSYLVQLLLRQGDKPIGSPKLLVATGQSARAAATSANGARYDITLSVVEHDGSTYLVKMDLNGNSANGRSVHVMPAALVKAGEPTDLILGPADEPLSVTLVVTPAGGALAKQAEARPVIGSTITTVGEINRQKGKTSEPPQMVKASPEVVRAFVNETFDSADKNHSGYIERDEAPETLLQSTVVHKGPIPKPGDRPIVPDDNEPVNVMKGPAAQAAYLATMDKDADGKVSREEYQAATYPRFLAWGVPATGTARQRSPRSRPPFLVIPANAGIQLHAPASSEDPQRKRTAFGFPLPRE